VVLLCRDCWTAELACWWTYDVGIVNSTRSNEIVDFAPPPLLLSYSYSSYDLWFGCRRLLQWRQLRNCDHQPDSQIIAQHAAQIARIIWYIARISIYRSI
jgi:hypothetical protein